MHEVCTEFYAIRSQLVTGNCVSKGFATELLCDAKDYSVHSKKSVSIKFSQTNNSDNYLLFLISTITGN